MLGRTISHFEILEKLGEGGMGVVYKARDTHLDRLVAIKVLPAEKVASAERKRRFVQEAKSASALNHPNIVTIFDIDQLDGVDFIAMEFVAGKTLDELIPRKGMRLSEALKVAVQIADALAAAHGAGIVHRDLKPGNIMVGDDGRVRVLDFGLAKLTEAVPDSDETRTVAASSGPHTEEGTILGTVNYMSPEQAEGRTVDTRSDIFSFGSVLYEMITGRRAFRGDSKLSTLAAIITQDPRPVREIVEDVPGEVERLIRHCLRKDTNRRFQHMADVKTLLEELQEESDSGTLAPATETGRARRSRLLLPIATAGVVVLGAGIWYGLRPTGVPVERPELTRLTSNPGLTTAPALSLDGRWVAYASDRASETDLDIWVQQVETGDRKRLTDNEADEREPAFSPDGTQIAYRSEQDGGGIYVVSILGGEPRRLVPEGRSPRFSPDGSLVAYWVGGRSGQIRVEGNIFVASSGGGQPRLIRGDFARASHPVWSPDGRHIMFRADQGGDRSDVDWWVTSISDDVAPAVRTHLGERLAGRSLPYTRVWRWMASSDADGSLCIATGQSGNTWNSWKIPISLLDFQVSGPAQQLTFGTGNVSSPGIAPDAGGGSRLVFASLRQNPDIWSLPLDADSRTVTGPLMRITDQESWEIYSSISEDGRKLVYLSDRDGSWKVWRKDLIIGEESPVSPGSSVPVISRDGLRIVFGPGGDPPLSKYVLAGNDPVLVCEDCGTTCDITRDGEMLIDEAAVTASLRVVMTASKRVVPILKRPAWGVAAGRLSPDERWIAFHAIPDVSTRQVFVAPFRGADPINESEWIPVTDGHGMERYARWSPDGNTLYFLSERDGFRCIRAQRLDPVSKRPVGSPLDIQHFHHARRSLSSFPDPVVSGFGIAKDKTVFALPETTGNIWATEILEE